MEHDNDLYWHALNYRTAGFEEAEAMWQELQACVKRLVERQAHDDWIKCMAIRNEYDDQDDWGEFHGADRCQRAIMDAHKKLIKEE